MSIDIARARAETPGTKHVVHLNNAGSSLAPKPVMDAMFDHLSLEATIGGYEAEERSGDQLDRTYGAVAALLNCDRGEVALVESATMAWDMAFHALRFQAGDRILTGMAEYASNVIPYLKVARECGALVEVVPDDGHGQLDVAALSAMMDERVRLIAVTHIPTNGGLVNPAPAIGRVARAAGVPFLLDSCQAVGQMPLDVEELCCDFLSASGRKFLRAPRGTGFLYVRRAWLERLEPPFLDLHGATLVSPERYVLRDDARRFELWESNVAGRIGLGVAVDYALSWGLEAIRERAWGLAAWLREVLAATPGVTVHDLGRQKCAIVTFSVAGRTADWVKAALAAQGIHVSVSRAASTRYDMDRRGLTGIVRVSPHYYNTETELERLVDAVAEMG